MSLYIKAYIVLDCKSVDKKSPLIIIIIIIIVVICLVPVEEYFIHCYTGLFLSIMGLISTES